MAALGTPGFTCLRSGAAQALAAAPCMGSVLLCLSHASARTVMLSWAPFCPLWLKQQPLFCAWACRRPTNLLCRCVCCTAVWRALGGSPRVRVQALFRPASRHLPKLTAAAPLPCPPCRYVWRMLERSRDLPLGQGPQVRLLVLLQPAWSCCRHRCAAVRAFYARGGRHLLLHSWESVPRDGCAQTAVMHTTRW